VWLIKERQRADSHIGTRLPSYKLSLISAAYITSAR
jgi:hypothetical protein